MHLGRRVTLRMILLLLILAGEARGSWTFELFSGAQYNVPMPLVIRQQGFDDLSQMAAYASHPFSSPLYYAWRLGKWDENTAWELELVHQKLFLHNRPDDVQNFEVSHGYNLLTVNRAWQLYGWHLHAGLGMVITHPETTVRGKTHPTNQGIFNGGYYVSGVTTQIAVGKRLPLWYKLFATLEGKLTASFARVPIADGSADVPNIALHGLFGLGAEW